VHVVVDAGALLMLLPWAAAVKWYTAAAEQGHKDGAQRLQDARRTMQNAGLDS
jgi:TPR repeat protein